MKWYDIIRIFKFYPKTWMSILNGAILSTNRAVNNKVIKTYHCTICSPATWVWTVSEADEASEALTIRVHPFLPPSLYKVLYDYLATEHFDSNCYVKVIFKIKVFPWFTYTLNITYYIVVPMCWNR